MAIKVAFWNCTLGAGSSADKCAAFVAWREWAAVDLLILEEASFTITNSAITGADTLFTAGVGAAAAVAPMQVCDFVNTLDINGNETTKQLVALTRQNNPLKFSARGIRLANLTATRMAIKASKAEVPAVGATPMQKSFEIYGMHANASAKGGNAAAEAATALLEANGARVVIGGDFNIDMSKVDYARKAASKRFDDTPAAPKPLTFTQWNTRSATGSIDQRGQQAVFGFTGSNFIYQPLQANGLIDFVMAGSDIVITPERNCRDEKMWTAIVRNFDHCPIVYSLT